MNFELDVTNDAEIQLIFDSKIGDIIKGRGTGNINMSINAQGEFKMYGDYQVSNGDYLFTLQNLINKNLLLTQEELFAGAEILMMLLLILKVCINCVQVCTICFRIPHSRNEYRLKCF